jgi:hypothetical protein
MSSLSIAFLSAWQNQGVKHKASIPAKPNAVPPILCDLATLTWGFFVHRVTACIPTMAVDNPDSATTSLMVIDPGELGDSLYADLSMREANVMAQR